MKRLTALLASLGLTFSPLTTSLSVCAAALTVTAQAADINTTLSAEEASKNYTLNLGPGSLAIITLPDPARSVLVTRSGLVETTTSDNHIIIAGISATGSVPLQFTTENGMWTWRIKMSNANAGNIVNINIQNPDDNKTSTDTPATISTATPASQATSNSSAPLGLSRVTPTATPPVATANTVTTTAPATANDFLKLTAADMPSARFTTQRDGDVVILTYRMQAGVRGLNLDERNLSVKNKEGNITAKPTLSSLNFGAGETRYGTIILNNAKAGVAQVEWPYRIGTTTQTLTQNIVLP